MLSPDTVEAVVDFVPSMKDRAAIAAALCELAVDGRWNLGLPGADAEFWLIIVWAALDNFPSEVNCDERAAMAAALCVDVSLAPTEELGVRRFWGFWNIRAKCYSST